jgi:protein phosphatase PTC1
LQSQIRRKSEETMKKAYHGARAKIREKQKADEPWRANSVSVLVINTGELVMASMGNYRAVVCRAATAHVIGSRDQKSAKRYWSRRLISGMEEHFPTF